MTLTVIALGLATATAYGASDFLGGLASRRAEASLAVVVLLKGTTVAVFLAGMPLTTEAPNMSAVAWGGFAGLALAFGYIAYFRGLVMGPMGLVATVTAIWSAVVPLAAGLMLGERPSLLTWTGIGVIVLAIVLITFTRSNSRDTAQDIFESTGFEARHLIHCAGGDPPPNLREPEAAPAAPRVLRPRPFLMPGMLESTVAGIGFGIFFVALDRASAAGDGVALAWPLLASAASAVILVGMVAAAKQVDWNAALGQAPVIAAAGVLYAAGSWAFIFAVSRGWISIVAVIAALSPAPTMILARLFLAESLAARQSLGMLLALIGIALVTGGMAH